MMTAELADDGAIVSIAYLSRDREYPQGGLPDEVFDRLVALVKRPFGAWCGHHDCDLDPCGSGSPIKVKYKGQSISTCCSSDILVPGENVVYSAPALILHYIRAHHYQPPAEFVDAVMRCPEPGSAEHVAALRRAAPGNWFLQSIQCSSET